MSSANTYIIMYTKKVLYPLHYSPPQRKKKKEQCPQHSYDADSSLPVNIDYFIFMSCYSRMASLLKGIGCLSFAILQGWDWGSHFSKLIPKKGSCLYALDPTRVNGIRINDDTINSFMSLWVLL